MGGLIVMNKKAEEDAQNDGGTVEVEAENTAPFLPVLEGVDGLASSSAVAPVSSIAPVSAAAAKQQTGLEPAR